MKATGRCGVVLSAPQHPLARRVWGFQLHQAYEKPSPALRELLAVAVVLAADDGGPALTVLDSDGRRLGSAAQLGPDFARVALDLLAGRAKSAAEPPRALPTASRWTAGRSRMTSPDPAAASPPWIPPGTSASSSSF